MVPSLSDIAESVESEIFRVGKRKEDMLGGSSRRDSFVEWPYTFKVRPVCLPHSARTCMLTARLLLVVLWRHFDKSIVVLREIFSRACLDKQNSAFHMWRLVLRSKINLNLSKVNLETDSVLQTILQ